MTLYDFMNHHPYISLFMVWALANVLVYPFKVLSRYFRHKNIKLRGWPPAHLDADGDFKPKDESND